jgi:hypothetical protein
MGGRRTRARPPVRPAGKARKRAARAKVRSAPGLDVQELESLRAELERLARTGVPPRWNADPEDVRRSVAKLVLTLVEFVRRLLERQAIRRMDAGTLSSEQTEAIGVALMRLEETINDIASRFGLDPEDLNLDLGPVGRLM